MFILLMDYIFNDYLYVYAWSKININVSYGLWLIFIYFILLLLFRLLIHAYLSYTILFISIKSDINYYLFKSHIILYILYLIFTT
jgi:hypothetical protein